MIDKILEFGKGYKTQLAGLVSLVSGIIMMVTSEGDYATIERGWMLVLGGLVAIFLRQGVKNEVKEMKEEVKEEVKDVKQKINGSDVHPMS